MATTIGVTGSSGFIGRQLVRQLRDAGYVVHELGRTTLAASAIALPKCIDVIVHLAGRAHVLTEDTKDPAGAFTDSNVLLTLRVAEAALRENVRRFVFVSSAGVLGAVSPPEAFGDYSLPQPYDAYTRSKLVAERELVGLARSRIELTVLRPPLVYGSGARGNYARIERGVRAGWPLPIGGVRVARSVVGLRNLCDALRLASIHPAAAGLTMLVADREPVDISGLGSRMAFAMGRPVRQVPVPASLLRVGLRALGREADASRLTRPFLLQPTLIHEKLGWQAPYDIEEELAWAYSANSSCNS